MLIGNEKKLKALAARELGTRSDCLLSVSECINAKGEHEIKVKRVGTVYLTALTSENGRDYISSIVI